MIVWLPKNWIFILKCSAKASSAFCTWPFKKNPTLIGLPGSMFGIATYVDVRLPE
jgi:cell division protein FtsX